MQTESTLSLHGFFNCFDTYSSLCQNSPDWFDRYTWYMQVNLVSIKYHDEIIALSDSLLVYIGILVKGEHHVVLSFIHNTSTGEWDLQKVIIIGK